MGRSDTFQAGVYGGYSQGPVYADAVAGYAYSTNQMWRNILIPGLQQRTAQGRTGANQFYGQVETGLPLRSRRPRRGVRDAVRCGCRPIPAPKRLHRDGAQSLNLTVAAAGHQLAALGDRRPAGRRPGSRLAREAGDAGAAGLEPRVCRCRPARDRHLRRRPAMPFTTFGVARSATAWCWALPQTRQIAEATSIYLRYEGDISGQDSAARQSPAA